MSNISYFAMTTIFKIKIKEFFLEFQFTILAPLISTLIFILILATISHYYISESYQYSYLEFVVPGVIIMNVMQVSYQNISESLIHMKQIGSFNDYLISPISRLEILVSLLLSSIFISIFVGLLNIFVINLFINYQYLHFINIIYYLSLTSIFFSVIGSIVGFLFFTWDVQSSVSNFIITPISFLSGTFFSINSINNEWIFFFKFNPIYHLVNNFRGSFIENYESNLNHELILVFLALFFFLTASYIYHKGFKVIN